MNLRINKYLAQRGYCSRREADRLIERKLVKINGKFAKLGDKVSEDDKVEVLKKKMNRKYFAYYKPIGIVTVNPQEGEKSIKDVTNFSEDVFPVGRLDKDSHGLILMTNDGRVTSRLLNSEEKKEKEYIVTVDRDVKDRIFRIMERGMDLENGVRTEPVKTQKINKNTFKIVLTEGKRHQIRRMCAALQYEVMDLKRVRVANVALRKLKPGESRQLEGEELKNFLDNLKIKN